MRAISVLIVAENSSVLRSCGTSAVRLVQHDVLHRGQRYRLALHQVQQASRRGHDDVYALFEGAYLAFDGRAAVDGQHPQAVDILGIVVEVARYLQAEFARGAEDERLWLASVHIGLLQQRQSIGGGLSRAGLRQSSCTGMGCS